jgi:SNF2 family DNA or RNA helicase
MGEWKYRGFEKFFGNAVNVLYLHKDYLGTSIETVTRRQVVNYDFVVTTYDLCLSVCKKNKYYEDVIEYGDEHTLMKGKIAAIHARTRKQSNKPSVTGPDIIYTTPWERVICDESQRFANPKTQTYKYMMAIYGKYKWCLTGTPIRNYKTDIWAQFRFCGYTSITTAKDWNKHGTKEMKQENLIGVILNMDYESAGIKLPLKHEKEICAHLKGKHLECYDYVLGVVRDAYDDMMAGLCNFICVLALFTRLRQCVISPFLLTRESKRNKETPSEAKEREKLLNGMDKERLGAWIHNKDGKAGIYSTRITEIIKILKNIKDKKILVFSMFTSALDLLACACDERLKSFKYIQIDGDVIGEERNELLEQFRNDPTIRAVFLTYKVGSEGLNLTEATEVICVEPWWNNAVHRQAHARAHRMGQTEEVTIHNVHSENTIEERVIEICSEKDEMIEDMFNGSEHVVKGGLDKYTLGRMLGLRK